jgi:antitoxin component of MazEF toxin-antitoxin module
MTVSNVEERFLKHVKKTDTCWNWIGGTCGFGRYGRFRFDGHKVSAHRMSMYLWKDFDLSDSQSVHHTCSNTLCVNPEHLRSVTTLDNMIEMMERKHYIKTIARLNAEVKQLSKEVSCLKRNNKALATNRG